MDANDAVEPADSIKRLGFTKQQRLTHARDFQACFAAKRSAAGDRLVVYGRPNGLSLSRIGLSIGRKYGNAVARNRWKRLCREAFRLNQKETPTGWDFIVVPRKPPKQLKELRPQPVKTPQHMKAPPTLEMFRHELQSAAMRIVGRHR